MHEIGGCPWCSSAIGADESVILLAEGEERLTTLAAEHESGGPLGVCYHERCYQVSVGRHPTLRSSRLY